MLGTKQTRLRGRHGETQRVSGLSDGQTRGATKGVYILQALRKLTSGNGKRAVEFASPCEVLGCRCPVRKSAYPGATIFLLQVGVYSPPLRSTQVNETLVHDDSGHPSIELGVASKALQVLEGSQIGGLKSIGRLFARAQNSARYSQGRGIVTLEQLRQRLPVAIAAVCQQFGIKTWLHEFRAAIYGLEAAH